MVGSTVRKIREEQESVASLSVFCIRADLHPESLVKILGLFAQRGIVPTQVSCRTADQYLLIDIEIMSEDDQVEAILIGKIQALVLVDRASMVGNGR